MIVSTNSSIFFQGFEATDVRHAQMNRKWLMKKKLKAYLTQLGLSKSIYFF